MTDPLRARLLAVYADEHRDHVAALRAALADGAHTDLEEAYRHAHSLKGAARAVDLPAVVELAHGLESLLEAWWEGGRRPGPDLLRRARRALDAIEDMSAAALAGRPAQANHPALAELADGLRTVAIDAPATPAAPRPAAQCAAAAVPATLRVEAAAVDQVAATVARLRAELQGRHGGDRALARLGTALTRLAGRGHPEVRTLCDLHAEVTRLLDENDWAVARVVEDLAEGTARLRLVTAETLLGGFGPMVRDIAASLGKQVFYDAEGLTVMAARDVLTTAGEAVSHLLRNAVVHGIETPAERRAAGKDEVGRLWLSVRLVAGRVEIRVGDDGRGFDTGRLAAEAASRGLLTPAQASGADPERVHQLAFLPGLSTAADVTTAAGRGMGMAIVRRLVDRLQGTVSLASSPGAGTEVTLLLPVSIVAQRLLLARVAGEVFALPASALARIALVPRDEVRRVEGRAMAMVDGDEVALADLASMLGLSPQTAEDMGGRPCLCTALVRGTGELLGLVVDEMLDVRDMPVVPLEGWPGEDPRLAGTVVLDHGELALVLAPAGLRGRVAEPPARAEGGDGRAAPVRVLVVDDSITTRTLERSILEAHAYDVEVAVDGREALERMSDWVPDVVVSDIDMPRLDGFGLLAAIRADPRLASVPVVLVSSRGSAADRERGLALGADAYIVKTRFDQDELLRIVGRLGA